MNSTSSRKSGLEFPPFLTLRASGPAIGLGLLGKVGLREDSGSKARWSEELGQLPRIAADCWVRVARGEGQPGEMEAAAGEVLPAKGRAAMLQHRGLDSALRAGWRRPKS